ncbi:MAG: hypothetical protein HZC36_01695 [Armatimonadetes bacterium]|nr:hypothetical protein [Armatimonadota bacterium]
MIASLFLAILAQDFAAPFDAAASKRDLQALTALSTPELAKAKNPFFFLGTQGPYGVGSKGWHAVGLPSPSGKSRYIVFTTPLTSEDRGDQVFELSGGKLSKAIPETESFGTKLTFQTLELWFDIPTKTATFENTINVSRTAVAPPEFILRFSPCYRVRSITDSSGKDVPFSQAGGVVCVKAPNERSFALKLKYAGKVDLPGYAGSISSDEIQLANDYWYPMIARRPCAYTLAAHTPKDWTAVGQGEQTSVTETSKDLVTRYRMDVPVTYWSFSAGPYKQDFQIYGDLKVGIWSLTMPEERMAHQAELYRPILEFYSQFKPYPFTRWGALDTPHYGGGALEAYSYATYGSGWLPDEDGHETAHTWFGGLINNTYLKSLWNESFANFCSGLYQREVKIGNTEERRLAFVQDCHPQPSFGVAPLVASGVDIGGPASALGYGKGAMVLQVLEHEVGTGPVIESMKTWLRTHPKGEPGEWEDFESVFLATAGKGYKWFFDQWMRRPGYPDVELSKVRWLDGQVHAVANFLGPAYWLKLDVMLQFADGRREFKTCRIGPTPDSKSSFPTVDSKEKPVLVSFDPWNRLLRRYGSDEEQVGINTVLSTVKSKYVHPSSPSWMAHVRAREELRALPENLDGVLVVGSPDHSPRIKTLCEKVGFSVKGTTLTFKGTTVDLNDGGALAVVEIGGGKRCVLGLGTTKVRPNPGRARVAVFDGYGRFRRGITEPKLTGGWTFKL